MSITELKVAKAKKYIKQGENIKAINILKNILSQYPKNIRVKKILDDVTGNITNNFLPSQDQIDEILVCYESRDYKTVITLSKKLIEKFPNHTLAWKFLGASYMELDEYFSSIKAFKNALECNPKDYESYCNLGNVFQEINEFKEAESSYKKSLILEPNYPETHYNLGLMYVKLNRLDEAELSYKNAIKFKPDFAIAHSNLGGLLRDINRFAEAELFYKNALNIEPESPIFNYNLGLIQNDLKKYEKSLLPLKKTLILQPNNAEAYSELGIAFQALNKMDDAETCYRKMLSLDPKISSGIISKGVTLFNKGNYQEALVNFDFYNTDESRAKALECLYFMGKVDEIYNRIDENAKIDELNLNIAAFSSFISEIENKPTANRFCDNPLNFLYFSNLSYHCEDINSYIPNILKELNSIPSVWEHPSRPLKKGFQSTSDIFSNPRPHLNYLKSIITKEIDKFYEKFKKQNCIFIQKWPYKKHIKGWHVTLKEQGYQNAHIHPLGWLSGVIYLKVVPPLGSNEGAIEFNRSGPNCYNPNSSKKIYNPELGDIIFFPSSLYHKTIPFYTNSERIIISFDLQPNFNDPNPSGV